LLLGIVSLKNIYIGVGVKTSSVQWETELICCLPCLSEPTIILTLYTPSAKIMDARSFSFGGSSDLLSFMIYGFSPVDVSGGRLL
jgi:hypothetical protein